MAVVRRGVWWILLALVAGMLIGGFVIAYAGTHTYGEDFALFAHPEDTSAGIDDGSFTLVATVDIPAGAAFDPLIAQGKFQTVMTSANLVVPGAVTDVELLAGKYAAAPIYANEQIPIGRVTSSATPPE